MATLHVRMTDGTTRNFEDDFDESRGCRFLFEVNEVDNLTVSRLSFEREADGREWTHLATEDVASYRSHQWDSVREL